MSAQLSVTINLEAVVANWQCLNEHSRSADCGAVVKANAYGLGMAPVASALAHTGCKTFFVANLKEGVALRACFTALKGLAPPTIYVLQGCEAGFEPGFIAHNLRPVIISLPMLLRWQTSGEGGNWPCAVKINTGMNRLGLAPEELTQALANNANWWRQAKVLLMSHLACADEPSHPLNHQQLECFTRCLTQVRALNPQVKGSLANSGGVFLGQEYHFDLVRPGAALYGLNPVPGQHSPVRSVVDWRLPILQVRTAAKGSSVGYGAQTQLLRDSVLAIVAGGYADGILRAAFPNIQANINGVVVPIAGRVSMDSMAFDVTDAGCVAEGDEITVLGEEICADKQGAALDTIGYELLTHLGARVSRCYRGGGVYGE